MANIDPQQRNSPKKMEQEEDDIPPLLWAGNTDELDRINRKHVYTMPSGYGFVPAGEELIRVYLNKKGSDLPFPLNWIQEVNVYNYHPLKLTSVYKSHRGKEWYFFTPRSAGKQPLRSVGNGFWKASSADIVIRDDQSIKIGTKRTLVYYEGKVEEKNKNRTDWIMYEYRKDVDKANNVIPVGKKNANGMKLDECVLCKIYKEDGDNLCMQQDDQVPNTSTIQGRDDPNSYKTARLFMKNVQVSNPNTNQGSYVVHFDTLDNLKGQENGADFDKMVSTPMSDYDPNFRYWGNGCVYTQSVSNEVTQVLDQFPIFQAMVRDSTLPVQNVQEQIPNSPNACIFSCFFGYVSE